MISTTFLRFVELSSAFNCTCDVAPDVNLSVFVTLPVVSVACILLELISYPPIVPSIADTFRTTISPSGFKCNLDELISIFPKEPLTYCEVDPK